MNEERIRQLHEYFSRRLWPDHSSDFGMELTAEVCRLRDELAALRAQAVATGTVELTEEEISEYVRSYHGVGATWSDRQFRSAVRMAYREGFDLANQRTRPAASAGDEKRDQEEVVGVLWAGGKFCVPCWLRTETFEAIRDMGDRLARQDTGSCMKCGRDVADVFDAMLRG